MGVFGRTEKRDQKPHLGAPFAGFFGAKKHAENGAASEMILTANGRE
jgi:hypothetical protein